ncbi:MAG: very short patch repair endonuclease [Candidatus Hadarchaeum sp.]|uniref:very short patch repair endonuclease n=1 Tax=Candidatus Hadarchaeum sp. TaxID=2883567 RepID=UPI00316D4D56
MSKEARSRNMARIRSKNTGPELAMRRKLYSDGLRFRIHFGSEKIDLAFPKKKVAVFIDGCFWHSCPVHGSVPKSRIDYWIPKLRKNIARAEEKDKRLKDEGWTVIHIWEHSVKKDIDGCARLVEDKLSAIKT